MISCVVFSACVSSTVQSSKPAALSAPVAQTSEIALSQEERTITEARIRAIEEIHAKADAMPENEEIPNYNVPRQGETARLTQAQIEEKTRLLNADASNAQAQIPDSKVAAKQREIANLRRKGSSHYKDALAKIRAGE